MDIAEQLARYLDDANFGTLGTDIFVGQIPDNTNGVYIVRTGGSLDMYTPIEKTVVDVYVRDTSASDAIATLESIKRYLHRMHNTLTSAAYIYSILALGDVEDIDRDLEHAKIFKVSFTVTHRAIALIS